MKLAISKMFLKKARQDHYEVVKDLMMCELKDGESTRSHVQKMHRHVERWEKLNEKFDMELPLDTVLKFFCSCYDKFILTYHLNNTKTILIKL